MKAKILVYALPALILATIHLAEAQQPKKVPRIGYLSSLHSRRITRHEAFRQGLRNLVTLKGKNIVIEYRYAEGKADRFPSLRPNWSSQGRRHRCAGVEQSRTAKKATKTIPIVMATC